MNHNPLCIFCKIVKREEKAWIIWENDLCIAFLTPYPNTPGFTVLALKEHASSYLFDLTKENYLGMLLAAQEVGLLLDKALGSQRTGLIMEGIGINHAHIKLIPMHGIHQTEWKAIKSENPTFSSIYKGYISSNDGPQMPDAELDAIHKKILASCE
ncbi:MAG: HIT family protein [Chitinophagales bacterium]|nr:HIT family protein [Chitinophagales bacterium]